MGRIEFIITTLITSIVIGMLTKSATKGNAPNHSSRFIVKQTKAVVVIGLICALVFGFFLVFSVYAWKIDGSLENGEMPFIFGIFGGFFLLGIFLMIYAIRYEIRIDGGEITYKPAFGRAEIIAPADIAYVKETPTKLTLYDAWHKKILVLDGPIRNRGVFVSWLKRYCVPFGRNNESAERKRDGNTKRQKRYITAEQAKHAKQEFLEREEKRKQYLQAPPNLPDNLTELMRPFIKTSLRLEPVASETPCRTGRSKFGGMPDLPPDFKWDYFEGEGYDGVRKSRPLAFLLQINCREVYDVFPDSPLPKAGLLSFFYELDTMLWGPEMLDKIDYVKVHYFPPTGGLVKTPLPHDLKDEYRVPEHVIDFKKEVSLPSFEIFNRNDEFDRSFANGKMYDQARASLGMPYTGHGELGYGTQMFGWTGSIQNDVFDEFTDEWLKGRLMPDFEIKRMRDKPEQGWELLLQVDSVIFDDMDIPSIMFGDSGMIYFGIRTGDLQRAELEKAWFTLQCY